jgi:hypothetical protein
VIRSEVPVENLGTEQDEGIAMNSTAFNRTAIAAAYVSGAVALAYSVTFGYYVRRGASWAQYTSSGLLVAGGLVGLPVLVALYHRLRSSDEGFALVAVLIAAVAAFGSTLHGAHDVAVFAHPDQAGSTTAYPNFTDPRGFATFGLFGLGLVMLSLLMRSVGFSARTSVVGVVTGLSTIVVYIGRVTVLDPQRWWVAIAAVASGVVGLPLWNVLVGRDLTRLGARSPSRSVEPPSATRSLIGTTSGQI